MNKSNDEIAKIPRFGGTARGFATMGGIAAAAPFFLSLASTSTVGGTVTYRDYVALGGGTIAVLVAIACIVLTRRTEAKKGIMVGVALLALGCYQLARGVGIV